jgi:hypothetical protein
MHIVVWYELDDDPCENADGLFETAVCKSCGQLHLVETKTGKVVGVGEI